MEDRKISVRNVLSDEDLHENNAATKTQSRIGISRNLLKIKRWEAGLKQYELAFLLGCSAPYLSMVENNRVDATREFKRKAAAIFEIDVNELFPGTE